MFFDCRMADLVESPIDMLRRIYGFVGATLSEEQEARVRQYLEENPQNKHGEHKYAAEMFGLDTSDISKPFEEYIAWFIHPS